MRSSAPRSTGMHTAILLSGASGVGIGRVAPPALPSCREPHDLPDAPLSGPAPAQALAPHALDPAAAALLRPRQHCCLERIMGADYRAVPLEQDEPRPRPHLTVRAGSEAPG